MLRKSHIAVKLARNLTPLDVAKKVSTSFGFEHPKTASIEIPLREKTAHLEVYNVKTLPREIRDWIWTLFETNMRALYEQSIDGWDERGKQKELFHSESRFFVLRSNPLTIDSKDQSNGLLGYTVFRFDTEETAQDEDADVVYCYELQVEESSRGMGIGRALMGSLERIGKETRMDKTMLTVFRANESAGLFYRKIGYNLDEIDPSNYEDSESVDYEILSKTL